MGNRWLIRGSFMLPVLLCVVAWGWSYPFRERIAYAGASGVQEWAIELGDGGLFLGRSWGCTEVPGWSYEHLGKDPFASDIYGAGFCLFGFQFFRSPVPPSGIGSFLIIPFWFPTVLSVMLLFFVWRRTKPKNGGAVPVIVKGGE
jgi:hypothetical protein